MSEHDQEREDGAVVEAVRPKLAKPPLYQVILLNDDYTPMHFVVEVLQVFFGMDYEKANQVMLHVHQREKGVCGVFTREIAETKVAHVNQHSRESKHPLMCEMEEADYAGQIERQRETWNQQLTVRFKRYEPIHAEQRAGIYPEQRVQRSA